MKHGGYTLGDGASCGQISTKSRGLFGGWQLFVEEQIHHVLWGMVRQFRNGITAVVHPLGGRHERSTAGANGDATQPGIEVG